MKIIDKKEFDEANVFGMGQPNTAYAQYFVGESFLNPLVKPGESSLFLANVTFEPGCRNNWHIHHAASGGGQMLICTAGSGWYQEEGREAVSLEPGMVEPLRETLAEVQERQPDPVKKHRARVVMAGSEIDDPDMAKKAGASDSLTLTGGCAKNDGLKQAIERVLKVKVIDLPVDPQLMGALGAAEFARQKGM